MDKPKTTTDAFKEVISNNLPIFLEETFKDSRWNIIETTIRDRLSWLEEHASDNYKNEGVDYVRGYEDGVAAAISSIRNMLEDSSKSYTGSRMRSYTNII